MENLYIYIYDKAIFTLGWPTKHVVKTAKKSWDGSDEAPPFLPLQTTLKKLVIQRTKNLNVMGPVWFSQFLLCCVLREPVIYVLADFVR